MVEWQEVIWEWVNHESVTRPDFKKMLKKKEITFIKNYDFKNYRHGRELVKILARYRPYLSLSHFTNREWSLRTLNKTSLDKLILPLDTGWKYISGGSYKPSDAADTIFNKPDAIGKRYYQSVKYITRNYKKLSTTKHKLIVIGDKEKDLHIVEGAHRLVAIFYRKLKEPGFQIRPMQAYVGKKSYSNWRRQHK